MQTPCCGCCAAPSQARACDTEQGGAVIPSVHSMTHGRAETLFRRSDDESGSAGNRVLGRLSDVNCFVSFFPIFFPFGLCVRWPGLPSGSPQLRPGRCSPISRCDRCLLPAQQRRFPVVPEAMFLLKNDGTAALVVSWVGDWPERWLPIFIFPILFPTANESQSVSCLVLCSIG